jgi:hypothetical protein
MRGEPQLLRIGEYLVGRACQRLPQDVREERYREWAAELPAILHDPQTGPAPRRAVRMLAYAADTLRGAIMTPAGARRRTFGTTAALCLLLALNLAIAAWQIRAIVRAPGNGLTYVQLAWTLLVAAYFASVLARSAKRVTQMIAISSCLAGALVNLWNAARAPGDWVYYFWAAFLFLLSVTALAVLLVVRIKRHKVARTAR